MKVGDVISGRYELIALVGEGGMGSVYRARDRQLERMVAIKLMRAEVDTADDVLLSRFRREAQVLAKMRHPNIAAIHDFGFEGKSAYIIQDFIHGTSLQKLSDGHPLASERAVSLLLQACRALDYVHKLDVVHRDIKPSNFIVEQGGHGDERLILLDFGIAKTLERPWDGAITGPGIIIGTPYFMAPEQMQARPIIDHRADLYALGAVAFQLLCGRPPFAGETFAQVVMKVVREPAPRPRDHGAKISGKLEAVILRCLKREPNARFASAAALHDALRDTPEGGRPTRGLKPRLLLPQELALLYEVGEASAPPAFSSALRIAPTTAKPAMPAIPEKQTEQAPASTRNTVRAALGAVAQLLWLPFSLILAPLRKRSSPTPPLLSAPVLPEHDALTPEPMGKTGPITVVSTGQGAVSTQWRALPPDSEIRAYVVAAGLVITRDEGDILHLEAGTSRGLPPGQYLALSMAAPAGELPSTLSTIAYQPAAARLQTLRGSPGLPCYVLVADTRAPGIGVYRHWHSLAAERHVHVLSARPQALRAAVRAGEAAAHLRALLAQCRSDPFALEGPIEDELEFFGGAAVIRDILDDIRGQRGGIGVFGLDKWGTTSLLRRIRAELLMGGHHPLAWVDLHGLAELTEPALCQALAKGLQGMIVARQPRGSKAPSSEAATAADILALCRACTGAGFPERPVLILDRVDALLSPGRCAPEAAMPLLQALRRWAMPGQGSPGGHDSGRPVVLIGGANDAIVSSRLLRIGGTETENPLWRALEVHYTPLFTAAETNEFMSQVAVRAGMELVPEALAAVHELTGGHKYLCRLLGSSLRTRLARQHEAAVSPALVRDAAKAVVVTGHDYFAALLDRAPPATRSLLVLLSERERREAEILNPGAGRLAPAERLGALQFALRHHLIALEGEVYRLAIPLLGQWLRLIAAPGDADTDVTPLPGEQAVHRPAPAPDPVALRRIMIDAFSSDELVLLLADLGEVFDQVTSRTKSLDAQVFEIVSYFQKRLLLRDLSAEVRKKRPAYFDPPPGSLA